MDRQKGRATPRPVALSVAGSDPGGGAGIQADLKVFALHGVFGTAAIAALTAQNTRGVQAVLPVPARFVGAQIESVAADLEVKAVKTGMLGSAGVVREVARVLGRLGLPLVVDPVMVAKGGARLLREGAVGTLVRHLLPLATLVTPNLDEAEAILGAPVRRPGEMVEAARALVARGARAALVKGGHAAGSGGSSVVDVFYDGREVVEHRHRRRATRHTHGTGCVLSAAVTARLARGEPLREAVARAVADVAAVLREARPLGGGSGPADPLLAGDRFGRRGGAQAGSGS